MAKTNPGQPPATNRWINPDGTPTLAFFQYMKSVDTQLSGNIFGPLIQAANDAAAATAGVPLQGLYRNGNAVQIRLT